MSTVLNPILLVTGVPHSFTSAVSNFLLDNGAVTVDLTEHDTSERANYRKYESRELIEYTQERMKFRKSDLTKYFSKIPDNQVVLLKYPLAIWFSEEIQSFTERPVKVVFVMRNPRDIIASNIEKSGTSFIYNFERTSWLYAKMASCELPTFTLISERLLQGDQGLAKRLLNFCSLDTGNVSFESIDPSKIQYRSPRYVNYRFWNFLWKRLSFLFMVVKK